MKVNLLKCAIFRNYINFSMASSAAVTPCNCTTKEFRLDGSESEVTALLYERIVENFDTKFIVSYLFQREDLGGLLQVRTSNEPKVMVATKGKEMCVSILVSGKTVDVEIVFCGTHLVQETVDINKLSPQIPAPPTTPTLVIENVMSLSLASESKPEDGIRFY